MTWTPLSLAAPAGNAAEILAALPDSLSVLTVDPWQYGTRQGIGHHTHLSFPNAAEAVAQQVKDRSGALLAVGIAARSLPMLKAGLDAVSTAFPLPPFQKAARRAESLRKLEQDKFQLPDPAQASLRTLSTASLPIVAALKTAALRQESAAAIAALPDNPLAALQGLVSLKTAHDAATASALTEAKAGLAGAGSMPGGWRCSADSDLAAALRNGTPGHEFPLSVIVVFLGPAADLALLREVFS